MSEAGKMSYKHKLSYEEWVVEIERLRGDLNREIAVRDTLEAEHLVARTNAVADINRRLHENNEFRAQLALERVDYLTRDMYEREYAPMQDRVGVIEKTYVQRDLFDHEHSSLGEKIATMEKQSLPRDAYDREHGILVNRVAALELMASRVSGTYWAMGAMISAVVGIVTLLAHVYFK